MTKLKADRACESCAGMLVPPQITPDVKIPTATDYVCLTCGRPYRWLGNPPRLATQPVSVSDEQTQHDDE